jgi:hypothetical protein
MLGAPSLRRICFCRKGGKAQTLNPGCPRSRFWDLGKHDLASKDPRFVLSPHHRCRVPQVRVFGPGKAQLSNLSAPSLRRSPRRPSQGWEPTNLYGPSEQVDVLKGTGFSPYVKPVKIDGALAPEGAFRASPNPQPPPAPPPPGARQSPSTAGCTAPACLK